jgi:hypothetical protein
VEPHHVAALTEPMKECAALLREIIAGQARIEERLSEIERAVRPLDFDESGRLRTLAVKP